MGRVCASEALQRLVAPPVSQRAAQDADAEMPTLECIGLQNPQYLCFMNACIQAMVGCAPFCKILVDLRGTSELLRAVGAPTLAAFVAFTESLGVLEEVCSLLSKLYVNLQNLQLLG
jgi:ubiquitin C-terminal hydrolase